MLKDFAWNAFQMTGNLDLYVFYKEVSNIKDQEEAAPVEVEVESSSIQG